MSPAPGGRVPKTWAVAPPQPKREPLAREACVAPLLAQLLLNRGLTTAQAVQRYLHPDFRDLLPPDTLPGAVEAARRIAAAVREGRRIAIYGDYDVDGITATAILWHALKRAGAGVEYYVPSRFDEGYGINAEALTQLAAGGAQLVVSVDCGITAVEPARRARELGLELIITDHHQPGPELPMADVIVHPTARGAGDGNADLCGAGVALKVAWAFAQQLGGAARVPAPFREALVDATVLAALGQIADVSPMTGENRVLASFGLRHLPRCANVGLRALLEAARIAGKTRYDEYDVGYVLAPRLNAAGRLEHARDAVELLTQADARRAAEIARRLEQQNRRRREVEEQITEHAAALVVERGLHRDGCRGIVLAHEEWHAGVVGIVASRLVERFGRPTVLVALDNGVGQGSGRSIRHFPLHEALGACSEHLLSFGGHAMAAGVRLEKAQIDAFAQAFQTQAAQRLTAADLRPTLHLDDEVGLSELTVGLVEAIERMAPFGPGNPKPRLASGVVDIVDGPRCMGAGGKHVQFTVQQNGTYRRVVGFGRGGEADAIADQRQIRVAFEPMISRWDGSAKVELRMIDWQPAHAEAPMRLAAPTSPTDHATCTGASHFAAPPR